MVRCEPKASLEPQWPDRQRGVAMEKFCLEDAPSTTTWSPSPASQGGISGAVGLKLDPPAFTGGSKDGRDKRLAPAGPEGTEGA